MGAIKNFFKTILKEGGVEHYTPSPIANPSREANYDRFSDMLPYLAWIPERRLFVLEGDVPQKVDGIGFCLEMTPQTGATPDMADLLTTIFTYLPKGSGVQWSLIATPLIDRFLDSYVGVRLDPEKATTKEERERRELFRALAERQAEHFRKGATDPLVPNQPYLLRDFRIVMSVVIPATSYDDEDFLHEIESIRETCATTLKTYYQFDRDWGPEDLINWCAVVLNPQETILKRNAPHINYDEGRPIKEQIVAPNTVMRVTEDGLIYGLPQRKNECVAKCMSVRSYPDDETETKLLEKELEQFSDDLLTYWLDQEGVKLSTQTGIKEGSAISRGEFIAGLVEVARRIRAQSKDGGNTSDAALERTMSTRILRKWARNTLAMAGTPEKLGLSALHLSLKKYLSSLATESTRIALHQAVESVFGVGERVNP